MSNKLIHLCHQRSQAKVSSDFETLETLLHREFIYINASGTMLSRAAYIEGSGLILRQQTMSDFSVLEARGTAVVICRVEDKGTFKGQSFDATFRSSWTLTRTDQRWEFLVGHTTELEASV